ncbi:hypothetical protein [Ferruginibacter sp. HRS2-29]|uniref:hypothetical protein n=1 Tax=Ferruginibacter sp. HRS2-29 TaxID=2487334 RepID=UPI0020CE62DF|nr:hypothetical protein [Ferruginibacter sp. HRS2-29]MCP9752804.1 hypothetical protein [Ferruginibacter sp. HRS2-29]
MDNIYYYTYFLFIRFAERIKKDLPDSAFTGLSLFSTVLLLNVFTIVFYFAGSLFAKGNAAIFGIFLALIVLGTNYFILYKNREKIISHYLIKYQGKKHNTFIISVIIAYVIFSCIACARLAYLVRNNLL